MKEAGSVTVTIISFIIVLILVFKTVNYQISDGRRRNEDTEYRRNAEDLGIATSN